MRRSGIATDLPGKAVQKLPTNCQHRTRQNAVFIYYKCEMPKCDKTIVNIDPLHVFVAYLLLTLYGLRPREEPVTTVANGKGVRLGLARFATERKGR